MKSLGVGIMIVFCLCGCLAKKPTTTPTVSIPEETQHLFHQAKDAYFAGDFQKATQDFQTLIEHHAVTPLTYEAHFYLGEVSYARGDYRDALSRYHEAIKQGSPKDLGGRAGLKAALSHFALEEYREALDLLSNIDRSFETVVLRVRIDSLGLLVSDRHGLSQAQSVHWALHLLDDYIEIGLERHRLQGATDIFEEEEAFARVRRWVDDETVTLANIELLPTQNYRGKVSGGYVFYKEALMHVREGHEAHAREVLTAYLSTYPKHPYYGRARLLLDEIGGRVGDAALKIGVLVPLSGRHRIYGSSVLHGAECAVGIFSPCEKNGNVELIIRDAGEEGENATHLVDELAAMGVHAIIGPLSSRNAEVVARRAEELGVPLVSLAQREGIAEVGDSIFRNSISPASEVTTLVDYLSELGRFHRYFVLYPKNAMGEEYQRLFAGAVEQAGGKVVGSEAYAPHQMEFAEQFRRHELGKRMSGLVPQEEAIDALFIPDAPHVVGYIVPTLTLMGIQKTTFLGTSRWDNPRLIERGGKYLEGAIFVGSFFKDAHDVETRLFHEQFVQSYGIEPTLLEALGFDSVRMIVWAARQQVTPDRESIRASLAGLTDFPGTTGRISFDEQGNAHRSMHLLTVSSGRIVALR